MHTHRHWVRAICYCLFLAMLSLEITTWIKKMTQMSWASSLDGKVEGLAWWGDRKEENWDWKTGEFRMEGCRRWADIDQKFETHSGWFFCNLIWPIHEIPGNGRTWAHLLGKKPGCHCKSQGIPLPAKEKTLQTYCRRYNRHFPCNMPWRVAYCKAKLTQKHCLMTLTKQRKKLVSTHIRTFPVLG